VAARKERFSRSPPGPTDGDLRSVDISPDGPEQLQWMLPLELTAHGGRLFEEITAANVKRRFAILVNDKIESAPVINQRITGTSAVITMGCGGTKQDATKLRDALRRSISRR
jgi:preprotein translocase subunit SecD